ncbi:MAG TPA: peptidoglycan DD-metalloendopeptidase family protein [Candidatus Krumholzibacteria bacterium]|nr:peptidoglycan DD-metalloendopeptidase family protein [Candidatus Krumholzibacteria bacterium]HPD72087.1 peptidoglycan DD-metalloendopeptidase family protein [Candidatus Krumholzibacteria bacterium]HRY40981.1 peptidoglycan DD-metalloendopeptidase family protein [Candidatus Krumholzibacteria bacterium]
MRRLFLVTTVLALALAAIGWLGRQATLDPVHSPAAAALGAGGPVEHLTSALPLVSETPPAVTETGPAGPALPSRLELRVQRHQTFYDAMSALGVPHEDVMALVKAVKPFRDLRKIRTGELFRVEMSVSNELAAFGFDLDLESWVRYVRQENGAFAQEQGTYPVERRSVGVAGTIQSSLYESLQACGAPVDLAAKINDILGWDLDFSRDARRGDRFRIVYEEVYKDGAFVRAGPILACTYEGGNRDLAAYRYTLPDGKSGYYDRSGRNLQKQLMRAPLNYSRISSGFSYNRRHPVLGRNMPHLGIDYAAPVGTPVWAAGDGVVTELGSKEGNGRYVRIRHTNREYETLYLHFSRFAKGLRRGASVRQGEVIGYVGATGYATGPHLDFRVQKSGKYVNPRTLTLPPSDPIPAAETASYLAVRQALDLALVEIGAPVAEPAMVAALQTAPPPWWDPRQQAARVLPPTLRSVD